MTSTVQEPSTDDRQRQADENDMPVRPRRRLLDWIGYPVVAVLVLLFVYNMFTNPNWQWDVVGKYLFHPLVLRGVGMTILLTVVAGITGTLLGLVVASLRLSRSRLLRGIAAVFIGFMRAIPPLVLLLFIYFTAALFPVIGIGVPFTDIMFVKFDVNAIITQFVAAWLGLTLIMGAHTGEIFRGGVISVSAGQSEAAKALGMGPGTTFFLIVLPQAVRVSIPALANDLINLFKNTSLVSIIGFAELLTVVQSIYARTYQTIPLLIVAVIWYLGIVIVAMTGQHFLEKRFGRGFGVGANI
jgi:polar amino acid transport system permease protein